MHGKSYAQRRNKLTRTQTCENPCIDFCVCMMHQLGAWNVAFDLGAIFGVEYLVSLVNVATASQNTKTLLGAAQWSTIIVSGIQDMKLSTTGRTVSSRINKWLLSLYIKAVQHGQL